ncbi:ABC transporter permease [Blautia sp. HCP3S3_G3]|uniref:ABC transporter permease n=1 Tax=Blautia sp. HCP3S3_G3 TaxID=3438913 RepID=UPI003F89A1D0
MESGKMRSISLRRNRDKSVDNTKGNCSGMHSLTALYRKEMSDHITSKRFVIILCLVMASTIAGLYGALSGLSDAISDSSDFIFLKLYTTSGNSIPSYMSFIGLIGPFVGLIFGFDAINSERNNGTLNRLLSQPIYRDSVIIGKFLASASVISIMVVSTGVLIGAIGFLKTGIHPSGEELVRILVYLVYTIVYICFWLAMSMLFSVYCKHSSTSALASIALWIFFAIFMSLLASMIANAVYPINDQYHAIINTMSNYNCELYLNRISPYYLYSEAVSTILNPSVRTVNVVTMSQMVGAISGYLSLGQSLLLVWPHLVGMAALTLAAFTIAYVRFMRQEIRGN